MTDFDHFSYRNGKLFCENVDIDLVAQKQGSPLYVYSYQALVDQYQKLQTAFSNIDHLICYAVKANSNQAILRVFFSQGSGADVVSGGEMRRVLNAGCDPQKIVFSGVGKTSEEIHFALGQGILQFNVESEQELLNIQRIAAFLDKRANIAIRVNPNIDAKTHPHISTGLKCNKFGVSHETAFVLYQKAQNMSHIDISGISVHIGSQILDVTPFHNAAHKIRDLVLQLKQAGIVIKNIDMGGGLGICYQNEKILDTTTYAETFLSALKNLGCRIILEPGRFLVGNAGIFVTKVLYLKKNEDGKIFTIVDGGMNDLIRPALYDAYHEIVPVIQTGRSKMTTDVVGPVCETTDTFAKNRKISQVAPSEYLALMSCGAYGASMTSHYNSRGHPSEVLVKDKAFFVIRKPDRLEDMVSKEALPEFLKERS